MRAEHARLRIAIWLACVLCLAAGEARAEEWHVLYEEDFSSDPEWLTLDPFDIYWDSANEIYHCSMDNGGISTAATILSTAPDVTGSFSLSFDCRINSIDESAGLTFGLFDWRLCPWFGAVVEYSLTGSEYCTALYAGNPSPTPGSNPIDVANWTTGVWYTNSVDYDAATRTVTFTAWNRDTGDLLSELALEVDSFPPLMQVLGTSRLWPPEYNDAQIDFDLDNVRLELVYGLRLRVTGITWTNGNRTATIHYEANREVQKYYYRLYQAESSYQSTFDTSATFDDLGKGYYLFVVTARDTNGALASRPSCTWFFNRPVGDDFQVYLTSYYISDNDVTITYAATEPVSRYYWILFGYDWHYTATTDTVVECLDLADGLYYFVVTGRRASDQRFPVGGPARQFFYVTTLGF